MPLITKSKCSSERRVLKSLVIATVTRRCLEVLGASGSKRESPMFASVAFMHQDKLRVICCSLMEHQNPEATSQEEFSHISLITSAFVNQHANITPTHTCIHGQHFQGGNSSSKHPAGTWVSDAKLLMQSPCSHPLCSRCTQSSSCFTSILLIT